MHASHSSPVILLALIFLGELLPVLFFLETGFLCVPQDGLRLLSAGITGVITPSCCFTHVGIGFLQPLLS